MSSSPPLPTFNRQVILQAGVPGTTGYRWTDNRIAFDVKKGVSSKKNSADIELYNPAPSTVNLFQDRKAVVQLYVGYDIPKKIVQGTVIRDGANIERSGPDRVLRLEIQDGGLELECAQLNVSFSSAVDIETVLRELSAQSGLPLGNLGGLDKSIRFPLGVSLTGPAQNVLSRLSGMSKADWSVQDGVIQFVSTEGDTGNLGLLLSSETGTLIKAAKKEKGKVEIIGRLADTLVPGDRFEVRGEAIQGIFKAIDVQYTGDSGFNNDFILKLTGRPIVPAVSATGGSKTKTKLRKLREELEAKNLVFDLFVDAQKTANARTTGALVDYIVRFPDDYYGVTPQIDRAIEAISGVPQTFVYRPKTGDVIADSKTASQSKT